MDDPAAPGPDESPLVRYIFAAVFIAALLYDLPLGVRVGGVFLLGMGLYEGAVGRVPLQWNWQTTGYLKGPAAIAIVAGTIFVGTFLILAPDVVLRLLAALPRHY